MGEGSALKAEIKARMLDEWWVSHIENGEKTKVRIVLQPVIEIAGKKNSCSP